MVKTKNGLSEATRVKAGHLPQASGADVYVDQMCSSTFGLLCAADAYVESLPEVLGTPSLLVGLLHITLHNAPLLAAIGAAVFSLGGASWSKAVLRSHETGH